MDGLGEEEIKGERRLWMAIMGKIRFKEGRKEKPNKNIMDGREER